MLLATAAGASTVLAFAPFGWWPIQIATLALLFHQVEQAPSSRRGMMIGWAFGFGWSLACVHWLYVSMHRYGGMAPSLAVIAVLLFSLYLGVFTALATGLGAWLKRHWRAPSAATLLLILPALWAISEWLRGWLFTGFPWVSSGYAHSNSFLAGYAPLIGVYGIGWCAALLGGCTVLILRQTARFRLGALLLALAVLAGGAVATQVEWTHASGKPITARLLQGNVPQEMKFSPAQIRTTLTLYQNLIRQQAADLIATPETAIPVLPEQLPDDYLSSLQHQADQSGSHLLVGIPILDNPLSYTNSVIGFVPGSPPNKGHYRYNKHHLVPFGEFVPPGFRWFVNLMRIPLGDFSRGDAVQASLAVKDQQVLPNICYEDLFGEEIAEQIAASYFSGKPQPSILLNLSNIAWFGDTIALPQHLQISQLRAMETGRPMLRATNTGTTAVIDHKGRPAGQLPPHTLDTLAATVQGYTGATPYILYGNSSFLLLCGLMLSLAWLVARKYRKTLDWS